MGKAAVQGSDERALVLLDSAGVMTLARGKGNRNATREILPVVALDDQPDAREGQAGRGRKSERPIVPWKPGNAGGGKDPHFWNAAKEAEEG